MSRKRKLTTLTGDESPIGVPSDLLEGLEDNEVEAPEEAPIPQSTVIEIPVEAEEDLAKKYGREYYEHLKKSGTDLAFKGGWQKNLVKWIDSIFGLRRKSVLDIGCAAGSMTSTFNEFGCPCVGTDISKFLTDISKQFSTDLLNFAAWDVDKIGKKFDFIYIMETLSCIPESKIEDTFKAIRKVCAPGAIIFGTVKLHKELLNTPYEVLAMPNEDWLKLLENTGFQDISTESILKMNNSQSIHNYYKIYEWDLIVARAV